MVSATRPQAPPSTNGLVHVRPPSGGFPGQAFAVTHELTGHPLLTFEAIADLADELPRTSVICDRADQPLLVPEGGPPLGAEARPGDRIRDIGASNSWLTLLNIEQVAAYRDLVDACLDDVEAALRLGRRDMRRRVGFIFVSSPNSVTPAHFDIEQSIIAQIRGHKTVAVGEYADGAARQREIDRYWDGSHGSHGRLADLPREVQKFVLEPGKGVFIPTVVPHWVHNSAEPTLSMTLTFFTRASEAHDHVQIFNARLRRMHLKTRPPGRSAFVDRGKATVMRLYELTRGIRPGQRYGTPPSSGRYGSP